MADYVKIFDTTLRDGEQSPGFALSSPHKVEMAHQLARLGVDVVEAGFPAASPDDFAAVQRIAREVRGPIVAGLARAVAADIDQCWEAIKHAERPRIHTFLSSSDIHLEAQFNLQREQAKARAMEMVARARRYTPDVEFSPMDATRSDWSYVCDVLEGVIALTVRRDQYRVEHGINIDQLVPTSDLLQRFTGVAVQPNKAVVGDNAFAHESGIHQDGMLKDARTYEIMSAAAIGAEGTRLVLGKHSGRRALRQRLEELGLLLTQEELNHAFTGFKSLADYKKEVTDEDLVRIAENGRRAADGVFDAIGHVYR